MRIFQLKHPTLKKLLKLSIQNRKTTIRHTDLGLFVTDDIKTKKKTRTKRKGKNQNFKAQTGSASRKVADNRSSTTL